jgi:hypothetical protein
MIDWLFNKLVLQKSSRTESCEILVNITASGGRESILPLGLLVLHSVPASEYQDYTSKIGHVFDLHSYFSFVPFEAIQPWLLIEGREITSQSHSTDCTPTVLESLSLQVIEFHEHRPFP